MGAAVEPYGGIGLPTELRQYPYIKYEEELIRDSVLTILCTIQGQRFFMPDFGCFGGATEVALLDGTSVRLEDLVGRPVEAYGCLNGEIVPTRSAGAVFSGVRATVRVELDNGAELFCTPEHLWMLRDGSYARADRLAAGTSLMPLYRKPSSKRYEMVYDPSLDKYLFTHLLVSEFYDGGGDGLVVHHDDFNKRNNSSTNLIRMTSSDHLALHQRHFDRMIAPGGPLYEFWHSDDPEIAARRARHTEAAARNIAAFNLAYAAGDTKALESFRTGRAHAAPKLAEATRRSWVEGRYAGVAEKISEAQRRHFAEHPEARAAVSERARRLRTLQEWRRQNPLAAAAVSRRAGCTGTDNFRAWAQSDSGREHARQLGLARHNGITTEEILEYSKTLNGVPSREAVYSAVESHFGMSRATLKRRVPLGQLNHKVCSVSRGPKMEVFDLANCSTSANFALTAGVFVHNSRLIELVFEPNDLVLSTLAQEYVRTALGRWERRVTVVNVQTSQSENILQIAITYVINRINKPLDLVLQFSRDTNAIAVGG